jgi:hypothetical protein
VDRHTNVHALAPRRRRPAASKEGGTPAQARSSVPANLGERRPLSTRTAQPRRTGRRRPPDQAKIRAILPETSVGGARPRGLAASAHMGHGAAGGEVGEVDLRQSGNCGPAITSTDRERCCRGLRPRILSAPPLPTSIRSAAPRQSRSRSGGRRGLGGRFLWHDGGRRRLSGSSSLPSTPERGRRCALFQRLDSRGAASVQMLPGAAHPAPRHARSAVVSR